MVSAPRVVALRRGLRFCGHGFTAAVFQEALAHRIVSRRPVARLSGGGSLLSWRGAGLNDGVYSVRVSARSAVGSRSVRRFAFERRGERFVARLPFSRTSGCGAIRALELARPVFGGRADVPLVISYRLNAGADGAQLTASVAGRVVRRFGALSDVGRTLRFQLAASRVPRGRNVVVRLVVRRAGTRSSWSVSAQRL